MLVGGNVVREKLEGDEATQASVFGLENHPHPTAAEFFDHPVMRDGLADHVGVAESLAASLGSTGGEVNEISPEISPWLSGSGKSSHPSSLRWCYRGTR